MSTEIKNDSKVFYMTNIFMIIIGLGNIIKKVWKIVNCTFLVDMTHISV